LIRDTNRYNVVISIHDEFASAYKMNCELLLIQRGPYIEHQVGGSVGQKGEVLGRLRATTALVIVTGYNMVLAPTKGLQVRPT